MARVFALDESHCDSALRSALQSGLRVYDECVALPQAHKSVETGAYKNVVMNLNASEPELDPDIFSPNWFTGVSAIRVPTEEAERLLRDPTRRAKALQALAEAIPSEMAMKSGTVGPELECTEQDRDLKPWDPGFDTPGCCVGLYSAVQSKNADANSSGISRAHNVYFLVCKAGGGLAAQTFHSRLTASLKKGMSLDEALAEGNSPGAQALRRVTLAGQRNRGRILVLAAQAIGLHSIDTLNDTACPAERSYRVAVCNLNVVTNSIRRVGGAFNGGYHYFSGCVDTHSSEGVISASNAAEGFLLFSNQNGDFGVSVKNDAFNSVPFSSVRLKSNREMVMDRAAAAKRAVEAEGASAADSIHPDADWIKTRFAWTARDFGFDMEPPPLMGTYSSETFSSVWGRELGLSSCRPIRLAPEIVSVSAVEPAKLRAAAKHVLGPERR